MNLTETGQKVHEIIRAHGWEDRVDLRGRDYAEFCNVIGFDLAFWVLPNESRNKKFLTETYQPQENGKMSPPSVIPKLISGVS